MPFHPGILMKLASSRPGGFFANRDVDYAEVGALWDDNWRAVDIAEQLACHVTTVYRALRG